MKTLVEELKLRAVRINESVANKQVFADAAKRIEELENAGLKYFKAKSDFMLCKTDVDFVLFDKMESLENKLQEIIETEK